MIRGRHGVLHGQSLSDRQPEPGVSSSGGTFSVTAQCTAQDISPGQGKGRDTEGALQTPTGLALGVPAKGAAESVPTLSIASVWVGGWSPPVCVD